jgi:cell division septation protein DedD
MSMSRLLIPSFCVALAATAPTAGAQQSTASALSSDRDLARAQRLVSSGEGARGRALVDSVVDATPPDSPRFPEALFTRATLAATAAAAERDYRRIFIEYPLSARAPEAIMRLAQLEIARGDRVQAATHLERLTREHPGSPAIPRANYWLARVRFEQGNTAGGCEALTSARSGVSSADVELRNQIEYYATRCLDVRTATAPARPPAAAGAGRRPAADTAATRAPQSAPPSASANRVATSDTAAHPAARGSAAAAGATATTATTGAGATTGMSGTGGATSTATAAGASRAASAPAGRREVSYSVQVAAYSDQASAERLVTKLLGRGYVARVDGDAAPFRVRIGRFGTWAAAAGTARKLKEQSIDGFVVETQPQ